MLSIEFRKAFDTIKRVGTWMALSRKGVPSKIIRPIRGSELAVLHNGKINDPFSTKSGVRQ